MLRYNFNNVSGLCARQWGTTIGLQRYFYSRSELRNYTASEGFENNKAGIPNGHLDPSSWILPQSPGGISAYENIRNSVTLSLEYIPPTPVEITGAVSFTITPSAQILGVGVLQGSITPFTELSPRNLADAVWNAEFERYETAGTMGKNANEVKINAGLIPAAL
jgi:hypothetical protein